MTNIRKNQLLATLIMSASCMAPFTANACDAGDVPCLLESEKAVPVQEVTPEEMVKESHMPEVAEDTTKESGGDEGAAMTEVDGYYEVDIENGGFYYFE